MSNKLYQFYNTVLKCAGRPFALCDKHQESYKPPPHLVMTLLQDDSDEWCNLCNQPWTSAGAQNRLVSFGKRTKPTQNKS